ncbi:hypothetical protein WJX77_012111 [Trebouxia sp. C0004]
MQRFCGLLRHWAADPQAVQSDRHRPPASRTYRSATVHGGAILRLSFRSTDSCDSLHISVLKLDQPLAQQVLL